jgi:hypothetical protein
MDSAFVVVDAKKGELMQLVISLSGPILDSYNDGVARS